MADSEFLKWITTLGVGGVLAGFIFYFYRELATRCAETNARTADALITVVKENTAAITAATVLMQALHRRLDREEAQRAAGH